MKQTRRKREDIEAKREEVIGAAYDAIFDPDRWTDVAASLGSYLDSSITLINAFDLKNNSVKVLGTLGFEAFDVTAYQEHFYKVDLWAKLNFEHGRDRTLLYHDHIKPNDFFRSEIYNDFAIPRRLDACYGIGATYTIGQDLLFTMGIIRGRSEAPHGREEIRRLNAVIGHLTKAAQISMRLNGALAKNMLLEEALSRLTKAVLILDDNDRILFANGNAESILTQSDAMTVATNGQVTCRRSSDDHAFKNALYLARNPGTGAPNTESHRIVLRVSRMTGDPAYLVFLAPLALEGQSRVSTTGKPVLVLLEDPISKSELASETMRRQYRLTETECRLASRIGAGQSLERAARTLGMTKETARHHLKSIFGKLNVHRQVELAMLISALSDRISVR